MKRPIMALLLAAALVAMPCAAFAADSPNTTTSHRHQGGGGGGGGGSSSTTPVVSTSATTSSSSTSNGVVETTNTSVVDPAGEAFSAGASYTRLSDGVVTAFLGEDATAALEAANPTTAYVAVGESKYAGLPQSALDTIAQLDAGNLSVPGLSLAGYRTYGTTVAIRAEGSAAALLYCSEFPTSGAQILFYNNWTGAWSLLPCTADPATGTVAFTVPTSGTAIIIGQ